MEVMKCDYNLILFLMILKKIFIKTEQENLKRTRKKYLLYFVFLQEYIFFKQYCFFLLKR